MEKKVIKPSLEQDSYVQPITRGGTESMSVDTAAAKLQYARRSLLGKGGGYVQLNDKGQIPKVTLPESIKAGNSVCIGFVNTAVPGVANVYQITNFHSYGEYKVRCDVGKVDISNDLITYTPLNKSGNAGFYVNDEFFKVIVGDGGPDQTKITSPVNQGRDVGSSVILHTAPFSSTNPLDTHWATQWQVSLDPTFTTVFFDSYYDTVNKISILVEDLRPNKRYYARVRYRGIEGVLSPWSEVASFNTAVRFLATNEHAKLIDWNAADSDYFGTAVSISSDGKTVIVGSPQNDDLGIQAGKVFVFVRSGVVWTLQARLLAQDGKAGDFFGATVSLSRDGTIAMIGASGKGLIRGSCYIFTRVGVIWNQAAKLLASDGIVGDYFGSSLSIAYDASAIVIGAMYQDGKRGAAYVFNRIGNMWSEIAKLSASDAMVEDFFGCSVAIAAAGKVVMVGAYGADGKGGSSGAVYAYHRTGTTWVNEAKLIGSKALAGDMFGYGVSFSITGEVALIGAYSSDSGENIDTGSVYIFSRNSSTREWKEVACLVPNDVQEFDFFGCSVGLSQDGSAFIVGAFNKALGKGAAYVYAKKDIDWLQIHKLQSGDIREADFFGFAVSMSEDGSTAAVGAYRCDSREIDTGAAYIFG